MNRTKFLRLLGIGTGAAALGLTLPEPATVRPTPYSIQNTKRPWAPYYRETKEAVLSDVIERECGMWPRRLEVMDLPKVGEATKKTLHAEFDAPSGNPAVVFRKMIVIGGVYRAVTGTLAEARPDELAYQLVKKAKELGRDVSVAYETGPYWQKRRLREFMNRGPLNA